MGLKTAPARSSLRDGAGLLLVLPVDGDRAGLANSTVAGLPLLRRIVLAAERAGFGAVLVGDVEGGDGSPLAGTCAAPLAGGGRPQDPPRRIVLLPANVVPQAAWLSRLREMPIAPDQLHVDGAAVAVVEATDPARVLTLAARAGNAREVITTLSALFKTVNLNVGSSGHFALGAPRDIRAAEAWLLRSLIKPSEGFMSRHVERRISLALSHRLVGTPITPNVMTAVSVTVGLASAPFFLSGAPLWQLIGALLFLMHSILDGCDGELARLKFLESPSGAVLDFWGDNLVHSAVFSAMALGWSLEARARWPLGLGAIAVVGTLMAAVMVSRRGVLTRAPGENVSPSSRLVQALAHRDFIYLIVILSAAGKAAWFLVLAACGTPVFLLLLLRSGRPAQPPRP